jgi:isocitrate/isopropylmalate dehydrogenase
MLDSREFKILQREFVNMCSMLTISDKKKGQYMYLDETLKNIRPDQVKKVTFVNAEKVIITSEIRSNDDHSKFEETGRVVLTSPDFFQLGSKLLKIRQTFDCFPNMQSTDPVAGLVFDMVSDILIDIIREKTPSLSSQDILVMTPEFTQLFFDAYEQLVNFAFSTDILRNLKTELSSRGLNVQWDVYSYYHFCISQISKLLQTMAERV